MQIKRFAAAAAGLAGLAAGPAWASDFSGLIGVMFHLYAVAPWALLQLAAFALLALFDKYRSREFAHWHVGIALLGPVAGLVVLLLDPGKADITALMLGVDAVAIALALLPLGMHAIHRSRAERRASPPDGP